MESPYTNENQFKQVLDKMFETYKKKNADYGNSFEKTLDEWGIVAGLVRMSDKMNRLKSLSKTNTVNFESVSDTLLDLANYAIMLYIWNENKR